MSVWICFVKTWSYEDLMSECRLDLWASLRINLLIQWNRTWVKSVQFSLIFTTHKLKNKMKIHIYVAYKEAPCLQYPILGGRRYKIETCLQQNERRLMFWRILSENSLTLSRLHPPMNAQLEIKHIYISLFCLQYMHNESYVILLDSPFLCLSVFLYSCLYVCVCVCVYVFPLKDPN